MQVPESVIIKGVRDGLLFLLDDDVPFPRILTDLMAKVNAQPQFFRGAPVTINAGRRIIDRPDFDVLYKMLSRNGMKVKSFVSLSAQARMVADGYGVASRPPSFAAGDAGTNIGLKDRGTITVPFGVPDEGNVAESGGGLFLRASLSPGQTLRHPGDICILGNVEPGAEITADGDVVVWGALRGIVRAGAGGDLDAIVCALLLTPSELSIGPVMARFPAWTMPESGIPVPQVAHTEDGHIVVEDWVVGHE